MTQSNNITSSKVLQDSKLGVIPIDWKVKSFGDISDKKIKWSITGGPFGSDLKSEHYTESGVRVIQLQNIGDGTFNQEYKIYTSEEKADQLIACNIFPGEIILSKMGDPVARACFIPNGETRYLMGSDGIRLVVDTEKYDAKFVLEYINYSIFRNLAIRHSTGSTRSRIGLTDLKKLPFICPTLPEQQKIAQILSTWDVAINKQEALIKEKQEQKKALMQQLLTGKKRFAGFDEVWEEKKLGNLGHTYSGLSGKTKEDFGNGKPYIPYMNIFKNSIIDNSYFDYVNINNGEKQNRTKYGDLFFTVSSETPDEVGMASVLLSNIDELYLNSFCFGFRLNDFETLLPEFAAYYLRGVLFRKEMYKAAQGATRFNLSKGNVTKVVLLLPSIEEQQKIAEVLTAADNEITALQQQLQQLKAQKQGLMQQLLTGKIRVKN